MDLEQFCENELHTYHFQLDTGEILCCKCELPKKIQNKMYSLQYFGINENMKESKKMIKYLLIEVTEDNEEILNSIPDDKIIDECVMSEDMVDRIGCPAIYNP